MRHIHKNTCSTNNSITRATAAIFLMLAITIVLVGGTAIFAPLTAPLQSAEAQKFIDSESNLAAERKLPLVLYQMPEKREVVNHSLYAEAVII